MFQKKRMNKELR
jgi:hypothetical protein